jgi:Polyketide cyclase / dehydrase and lipid transport
VRFVIDTIASPSQVHRALTDFTDRRLQTWNRTLDPRTYELRDQGRTWAVARESTPGSPFWVVARYDWSDPAVIRWTITESSYGGGGHGVVQITPQPGSGSRLHVEWDYTGAQRQKILLFLLQHVPMGRIIRRMWASALDRYAEADASGIAG